MLHAGLYVELRSCSAVGGSAATHGLAAGRGARGFAVAAAVAAAKRMQSGPAIALGGEPLTGHSS